jgi:MFS family permease
VSLVDQLLVNVNGAVAPYMTSSFERHGLTASTSIVSSIVSGASALTFAKIADNFGRVQTFLFTLILQLIAQTMKAAAKNIETYVVGDVFYWTAHVGFLSAMDLIIADSTTLKNRMLMTTINGTPLIISVFAGPEIATHFLAQDIRWAFGSWAIILGIVSIPPVLLMLYWERKAYQAGVLVHKPSGRTFLQNVWYYFVQFDSKSPQLVPTRSLLTRPSRWYLSSLGRFLHLPAAIQFGHICS